MDYRSTQTTQETRVTKTAGVQKKRKNGGRSAPEARPSPLGLGTSFLSRVTKVRESFTSR